jgi:hypothetical protein
MEEARAASLGHNQDVVRSLNEQLDDGLFAPRPPLPDDVNGFLCECSDLDCTCLIYVAPAKYAEVRGNARRFFVRPGHEIPDIEAVVESTADYCVVEKVGAAAEAVERDPA